MERKEHEALTDRTADHEVVPLPMTAQQIAADLTERIRSGEYPPGSQLPTYAALSKLYSCSEATITKVMGLLRERGVVVGIQGRGTFVPE